MKKQRSKKRLLYPIGLVFTMLLFFGVWVHGHNVAVLNPAGTVAHQERSLMATAALLGMLVIVPVYILTIFIVWKYREHNSRAKKYSPLWDHSRTLEAVWWAIPLLIITILSVITWRSSYALDPFRPIASNVKPLTVQVVALDWKWLFIYPAEHVASVNEVQLPVNTPIEFQITSDSVMNSFWIPQLGGQIYAMTGMSTQLHLMAGQPGSYEGSSANISGSGFAGMTFTAKAESPADFKRWVSASQHSGQSLTLSTYKQLAKPSKNNGVTYYAAPPGGLYDYVIMKYMEPGAGQ